MSNNITSNYDLRVKQGELIALHNQAMNEFNILYKKYRMTAVLHKPDCNHVVTMRNRLSELSLDIQLTLDAFLEAGRELEEAEGEAFCGQLVCNDTQNRARPNYAKKNPNSINPFKRNLSN